MVSANNPQFARGALITLTLHGTDISSLRFKHS